jgi:stage III sporulation protein AE
MRKIVILFFLLGAITLQISAAGWEAPIVPESGAAIMPQAPESFGQGLWELCREGLYMLQPAIAQAAKVCLEVTVIMLLGCISENISGDISKNTIAMVRTIASAYVLFDTSTAMIQLASQTIQEISEYGKLLLPVMTGVLAAQGGITASTGLYAGTAAFDALLSSMIAKVLVPMVYIFLGLGTTAAVFPREQFKKLCNGLKGTITWILKTLLYVFTGFMTVTGVVSGSTDAMALKATKLTISGMVPVVGSILSDASESVLISMGMVKNAAGIYGILAVLSVCLSPFLQIGAQYLMLKLAAAACDAVSPGRSSGVIHTFSTTMGLLLGMTGAVCLMLLISTVCFMKGMT